MTQVDTAVKVELKNIQAYETIGQRAYGNVGRLAVALCIFCQNMGAISSYLFIIKTELPLFCKVCLNLDFVPKNDLFLGLICDINDAECLSHSRDV